MRRFAGLALAVPLFAGCGQPESAVTVVESAAVTPAALKSEVCDIEWRTISTAVEAHFAQYQVDVTTIDELVPEMLREAPADWQLIIGDDGIPVAVPDADGRCAGYEPDPAPQTASTPPAGPTGMPCYFQQLSLQLASNAMFVETGARPTSQAELYEQQFIPFGFDLVALNPDGLAVPLHGAGCEFEQLDDESWDQVDPECFVDLIRLTLASGHYEHLHADETFTAETLHETGYLSEPVIHYDIDTNGERVAVSSRECPSPDDEPNVDDGDDAGVNCEVERRTVDTVIEAYWAQTGTEPTSLDQLVPDYLREEPENWILEVPLPGDGPVRFEPVPGGPCDS